MSQDSIRTDAGHDPVEFELPREAAVADLICFSHLRWDFVFQRPQHLMTRCARQRRVYYFEEPVYEDVAHPELRLSRREGRLAIATPVLPPGLDDAAQVAAVRLLLDRMIREEAIADFGVWYYTPMALPFSQHLKPQFVAYDCMDELNNFKGAPTAMALLEQRLLDRADVVFTGGQSLFEAKRDRHANVHAFPSSIDRNHFRQARGALEEPQDQREIRGMRLGFFGVIDERFDIDLVAGVARLRPEWQIVLLGPVVKIDASSLPRLPNIHYLGMKRYEDLPAYLAGWDVAIMPFARNDATRYISPTKTPEYLAGGKPVVSTSIHDVVHPYADLGLVQIADTPGDFAQACETALEGANAEWLRDADAFLARTSWDFTWNRMRSLLDASARRASMSAAARAATAALVS